MANKVITLNTNNVQSDKKLEVYRDLSMTASRKNVRCFEKNDDTVVSYDKTRLFVAKDVNINAIFNSLHNIFSWIQGERILNPEFGSKLRFYLYEGITPENQEAIVAEIKGVIYKYEPRVEVKQVINTTDVAAIENNTVKLDIIFTIPSLSNQQHRYSYTYNRIN